MCEEDFAVNAVPDHCAWCHRLERNPPDYSGRKNQIGPFCMSPIDMKFVQMFLPCTNVCEMLTPDGLEEKKEEKKTCHNSFSAPSYF